MGIESYLVAEMLQHLQKQGAMLRPHAAEIAMSLSKDEFPEARDASAELFRTLDAFVSTTRILREHIVAQDGMGELGESIGELVLRARGMVLIDQLAVLCDALKDPAVREQTQRWFVGRCAGINDLVAFVHRRVEEIHATWTPYRPDRPARPGMTEPDRSSLYRTAVRVAQRAMSGLRDEPELARFLDEAAAATDLPEVHLPCERIDSVLDLELDGEARRSGGRHAPRNRIPHGVPERS